MTSGVIDAPTATPRIVRAPTEMSPKPISGRPAKAAINEANIGPNRNGSGRPVAANKRRAYRCDGQRFDAAAS